EVLLQGQDLPPVAQGIAGQEAHLGERVEHDAARTDALHDLQHSARRLVELDFGRVEERVVTAARGLRRGQLVQLDAVERPAVGGGYGSQLFRRLREGDVEARLPEAGAFEEELK